MKVGIEGLVAALESTVPSGINEDYAFVCIGTDRSTGDALGPLVGTMLIKGGLRNVYGTLHDPVHALNVREVADSIKGKKVIAIDASLGQMSSVGFFKVEKGPLRPGAGVNKELGEIGDYSITGIVNVGGFMEYFVLQNTRLSLVMDMAKSISDAIQKVYFKEFEQEVRNREGQEELNNELSMSIEEVAVCGQD